MITILGLSTTTAGFAGPTLAGPISGVPEIITSFRNFERVYGGLDPLTFEDERATPNYLGQGADDTARQRMMAIALTLIGHFEHLRYRIAELDTANDQVVRAVCSVRSRSRRTLCAAIARP